MLDSRSKLHKTRNLIGTHVHTEEKKSANTSIKKINLYRHSTIQNLQYVKKEKIVHSGFTEDVKWYELIPITR